MVDESTKNTVSTDGLIGVTTPEKNERILSSAKLVGENRLKEASSSAYAQDEDDTIDAEMRRCVGRRLTL